MFRCWLLVVVVGGAFLVVVVVAGVDSPVVVVVVVVVGDLCLGCMASCWWETCLTTVAFSLPPVFERIQQVMDGTSPHCYSRRNSAGLYRYPIQQRRRVVGPTE